jgi:hypothetical protein
MNQEFDDIGGGEFDENDEQLTIEDVKRLLGEFRQNLPELDEDDQVLFDSLFRLLDTASTADQKRFAESGGLLPSYDWFLMTIKPRRQGLIFATTRDKWVMNFDAPNLSAQGQDSIERILVKSNHDAKSRFDWELLEGTGIQSLAFSADGMVEVFPGQGERKLTQLEKLELADYLDMATNQVKKRLG